jgi:hypothetical protein
MKGFMLDIKWVISFVAVFLLFSLPVLFAQTHQERVTIEGAFQPSIKDFEKQFVKPQIPETNFPKPDTSISRIERKIGHRSELEVLSPLAFRKGRRDEGYSNFLMAGMGSRLSPLFLYGHSSAISRDTRFGLLLSHQSSWTDVPDYAPSDFMNNQFGLSLDHNLDNHKLKTSLYYQMDNYRYYGFRLADYPSVAVDKADLKQSYQNIGFAADLFSTEQKMGYLNHAIGLKYNYLFNADQTQEHQAELNGNISRTFDWFDFEGEQALGADVKASFFNNNDSLLNKSAFLISALPYLRLKGSFYQLNLGLRVDYQPDLNTALWWYPVIRGNLYLLDKKLEFYAGTDGGINRISFKALSDENPWINPIVPLAWENKLFTFDAGLRAAITSDLDVHLGIRFEETDNSGFFIIDTLQPFRNSFTVVYDGMRRFNFVAEASWKPVDKWRFEASFKWNQYDTDSIMAAWHKPSFDFGLDAKWLVTKQFSVNGGMIIRGSQSVPAYINGIETVEKLDGIADLNLGADYKFTNTLSAYVSFENLLNQNHFIYQHYPVYGFEASAGIKVRF